MSPTDPHDPAATAAFWREYATAHPEVVLAGDTYVVDHLDEARGRADELLGMVRHGVRRATSRLATELAHHGEPLPRIGAYRVVCDGRGSPALVLRTVELRIATFREVDADFAVDEGDGDLRAWREQHRAAWERAAAARGDEWTEQDEIVLERFRVVWPPEMAD